MYHQNGQSTYPQNEPYQSHQTQRPFQQQQFGPRFQTPSQQFTPPGSFFQSPRSHHDHPRPHYQSPVQAQQFYQPPNHNFDKIRQPSFQPPVQNFETSPKPTYKQSTQNFETASNPHYPPSPGHGFNQLSVPPYTTGSPTQNYNQPPPIQNYNQPPSVQNYNQPPVQNFNQPPVQNFNQPPPIQNYNQPVTPYQSVKQNCHQPATSPYQCPSPRFGPTPNTSSYQPQVQSSKPLDKPYQLPPDQCYQQQQSSFNLSGYNFNQKPPFRHPGHQRFPFKNQNPRYQQPQHGSNNRFQFQPRQQNYRPRGPPMGFSNQSMGNSVSKKDKEQITCGMDNCDFVGHAAAIREHQNMQHRFGLHKKVLYSNNSDAVNNWIKERKKKWPTKENIRTKLEVEDEKNKRGERIADEDFQRFNNKNNKFNNSGSNKRFNNRKRPRFNGEFIEPVEEPMNGNLKRFAGITDIQKENKIDEVNKPGALKLLEEYAESSDDEPPEETAIVKESAPLDNKSLTVNNEEAYSTSEIVGDVSIENYEEPFPVSKTEGVSVKLNEIDSTSLVANNSEGVHLEVKIETDSKVNLECVKTDSERGHKRKKSSKKEFKPVKKMTPLRTPRTEVLERKGALLEALMGDLMRSERNAITQCICYIRNNMHRFRKTQAA